MLFFKFFLKHRDALIVPLIDWLTSFFSGFVIFTVLGAMAKAKGVEVADVATGGINVYSKVYLFEGSQTFSHTNTETTGT